MQLRVLLVLRLPQQQLQLNNSSQKQTYRRNSVGFLFLLERICIMKYLIAGLGNIGTEYDNTRHNIGFDVVNALAAASENVLWENGRKAHVAWMKHKGRSLLLLKPATYMNLSGEAVRFWLQQEKIAVENLLVIADELALPFGSIQIRPKGGSAGHNGLTSIIEELNTEEFARVRFGIGGNYAKGYQSDYVLGKWEKEEKEALPPLIKTACDIVKGFVSIGLQQTMNAYNRKKPAE
jgi:PTH1 family peptidyl-tRNA hydrolase